MTVRTALSVPLFANYQQFQQQVDLLCIRIASEFSADVACRRGCSGCCRHLSLFPVEAMALASALSTLPDSDRELLRARAPYFNDMLTCPLLHDDGSCLLYPHRPLICRTHGMPLRITEGSGCRVDFCPENFRSRTSLPGYAIIDLDRLNEVLVAINALYLQSSGVQALPERLSIGEALCYGLQTFP